VCPSSGVCKTPNKLFQFPLKHYLEHTRFVMYTVPEHLVLPAVVCVLGRDFEAITLQLFYIKAQMETPSGIDREADNPLTNTACVNNTLRLRNE